MNEELKTGDEVFVECAGDKEYFVVTSVICNHAHLIALDGTVCNDFFASALTKTGRHFPQIEEVLKQIGAVL